MIIILKNEKTWPLHLDNLHEAVANHFSLAVNPEGTQFLMNPNMWHFSRIKASDLLNSMGITWSYS